MTSELQRIIDSYPPCPGAILPYLDAQQKIEAMAERIATLEGATLTDNHWREVVRLSVHSPDGVKLIHAITSDYIRMRDDLATAHANISQRESAMDNLREELKHANIRAESCKATHDRAERQLAVIDVMREQLAAKSGPCQICKVKAEEIRYILQPHGLDHIEPVGGVQMLAGRLVDTAGKLAAANERIAKQLDDLKAEFDIYTNYDPEAEVWVSKLDGGLMSQGETEFESCLAVLEAHRMHEQHDLVETEIKLDAANGRLQECREALKLVMSHFYLKHPWMGTKTKELTVRDAVEKALSATEEERPNAD